MKHFLSTLVRFSCEKEIQTLVFTCSLHLNFSSDFYFIIIFNEIFFSQVWRCVILYVLHQQAIYDRYSVPVFNQKKICQNILLSRSFFDKVNSYFWFIEIRLDESIWVAMVVQIDNCACLQAIFERKKMLSCSFGAFVYSFVENIVKYVNYIPTTK